MISIKTVYTIMLLVDLSGFQQSTAVLQQSYISIWILYWTSGFHYSRPSVSADSIGPGARSQGPRVGIIWGRRWGGTEGHNL